MTADEITNFLTTKSKKASGNVLKILFKKRTTIDCIIIRENDYDDLKQKNFWRIIFLKDLPIWENTHNINLSRILNGSDFKKIIYANC